MTIWETLFGTPERTLETLATMKQIDFCDLMSIVARSPYPSKKCAQCICTRGVSYLGMQGACDRKDMSVLDWLKQEVIE